MSPHIRIGPEPVLTAHSRFSELQECGYDSGFGFQVEDLQLAIDMFDWVENVVYSQQTSWWLHDNNMGMKDKDVQGQFN